MVHRFRLVAALVFCALLASSVGAAQSVDASAAPDPAPMVEAGDALVPVDGTPLEGGAEPETALPAEVGRDRVLAAWREAPPTPRARAAALRRLRLEYGLGDLRSPARIVLETGRAEEVENAAELARGLAPQMPAMQWARIQELWDRGEAGAAVKGFGTMVWALVHQLDAQIWLLGNGLLLVWIVSLASAFAFIVLMGIKAFPHAAHDLGDVLSTGMPGFARAALLACVMLVPIWAGEGLAGLALLAFAIAFFYGKGLEKSVLLMAATLWIVALHPLAQWAAIATTVVDQDAIVRSALAVANGTETRADVERLEAVSDDDLAAAHALAYRDRRLDLTQQAVERLDAMAQRWPADAVVLANRATLEMRAGRIDEATNGFERAATQLDSPTLLFDLSQAYATSFRMDEYEKTLARAQRLDDGEIQALSSLSDSKLVADLGFPIQILRDRLRMRGLVDSPVVQLSEWIAPGRLGRGWSASAVAFGAVVLCVALVAGRYDRSSNCTRCGTRICSRCEDTVWSQELCEGCHHLFKNPEATDPKLRMARLQTLARRDSRIHGWVGLGTLLIPGVAGLAMRRPDLSLLGLALFVWAAIFVRWPAGVIVDPLWFGALAPFGFLFFGALAVVGYAAIVVGSLVTSRNR